MLSCFYRGKLFGNSKCLLKLLTNVLVGKVLFSSKAEPIMLRALNVAEKNDAAKSISELMSNGRYQRRNGLSVYNKIYEFEYQLFNQKCTMTMTSVSGHLLNLEFLGAYRKWMGCNPVALFDAPVTLLCMENYQPIKNTLEREVRNCQHLILWTDCDREGENIGFEIIEVCKKIKPSIQVHRARFSEITQQAITRAIQNLVPPDSRMNDAVNVRRELDLRIGAAFTRFQTLRLSKVFPNVLSNQLISYGSCQFPTLGFVVDRYKQVQAFIPEPFWKLKVRHEKNNISVEFSWKRGRLFDHTACLVLYQLCLEEPVAEVIDIKSRPKSKWRPQPLDTVELEKIASRKLRIGAKEALNIAEKLYTKGFISYPRTETTIFPKELNLASLVQMHCEDQNWGAFANRVLEKGPNPRQGTKTDNAHPPIHPIKYTNSLQGNEKTIYDFVVRHFLACLSDDAKGKETTIEISVNDEKFAVNGLMIIERNYLDVYPYEKWNAKEIPEYAPHERFQPSAIQMVDSQTQAPELLTEADLIALMEKHGIGTDATHAEHIETIKSRLYVGVNDNGRFVPGELGMGLVEGYDLMGYQMSKPHLRAELEADLKRICDGVKNPQVVLQEQVAKYKEYFIKAVQQANKIDQALSNYFQLAPGQFQEDRYDPPPVPVMKCPKCHVGDIVIKTRKENKGFYLSCMTYPQCNASMWLPECVEQVTTSEERCTECRPGSVMKLKFKVKRGSLQPFYDDEFIKCIGGCDRDILEVLNVRPIPSSVPQNSNNSSHTARNNSTRNSPWDSGFVSGNSSTLPRNQSSIQTSFSSNSVRNLQSSAQSRSPNTFFPPPPQSSAQSRSLNTFVPPPHSSAQSRSHNAYLPPPSHSNSGNASRSNAQSPDGSDVVCLCGKPAVKLMVRKEGQNKGRFFYKCPNPNETQCTFFLWADETSPTANSANFRPAAGNNNASGPVCDCSTPAKLLIVQKEGSNKGRKFFRCSNNENGCQFFKWEEDWNPSANQQAAATFNRPGTSQKRSYPSNSNGQQSKRRCGLCNEIGHNRKTCPQN